MKLTTRILILTLALAMGAFAQETTTATTTTTAPAAPATTTAPSVEVVEPGSTQRYQLRSTFTQLLHEHAWELPMLLKLDPSLLSNEAFVAKYPELKDFLAKHPEINRNPRFYLAELPMPGRNNSMLDEIVEMLAVLSGFALATFALLWLVRTIIEQRRWNRLTRTQNEVHNKILDRFGKSEEVLAYIQSPAGTKFLESAPIPLQPERPAQSAPFTRVFWSVQLGVVIAIAALGMLLVSFRFEGESASGMFALGAIALSIGVGFIASAYVSIVMSRRLGLLQGPAESDDLANPGLVR